MDAPLALAQLFVIGVLGLCLIALAIVDDLHGPATSYTFPRVR